MLTQKSKRSKKGFFEVRLKSGVIVSVYAIMGFQQGEGLFVSWKRVLVLRKI